MTGNNGEKLSSAVEGIHRWAVGLVAGVVMLALVEIPFTIQAAMALGRLDWLLPDDEYNAGVDGALSAISTYGAITLAGVALFALATVVLLVWVSRMWRAVPPLGAGPMRWSGSWAVGAWFVPILNLWRPAQVIGDLNRASRALSEGRQGSGWRDDRFGAAVWIWWLSFILASQFSRTSFQWERRTELHEGQKVIDMMAQVAWLDALSALSMVVSGLFLILIVRRATERVVELWSQELLRDDGEVTR